MKSQLNGLKARRIEVMHVNAREYDIKKCRELGQVARLTRSPFEAFSKDDELRNLLAAHYKENPPTDRPCDWCGTPTGDGKTTHEACLKKEQEH